MLAGKRLRCSTRSNETVHVHVFVLCVRIWILKQLNSNPTQLSVSLLSLQGRGGEHVPRQLRRAVGEAHIDQQLRQPAAGRVVALEAVGELWVAQQLWQALPQRLASPASNHTQGSSGSGARTSAAQSHQHAARQTANAQEKLLPTQTAAERQRT